MLIINKPYMFQTLSNSTLTYNRLNSHTTPYGGVVKSFALNSLIRSSLIRNKNKNKIIVQYNIEYKCNP